MTTGYSGTPTAKKLGIKEGCIVFTIGAPDNFQNLLEPLPADVEIYTDAANEPDIIHIFTNERDHLFEALAACAKTVKKYGAIWVSWYKKAAKLPTEITEDTIREAAYPLGLVDVKVCAVDEKWSGLKLVIRKGNRL
jgi:hypothetical protein